MRDQLVCYNHWVARPTGTQGTLGLVFKYSDLFFLVQLAQPLISSKSLSDQKLKVEHNQNKCSELLLPLLDVSNNHLLIASDPIGCT